MLRKRDDKTKRTKRKTDRKPRIRVGLSKDTVIDYKNLELMQKVTTPKGKILSRRFTNANTKQQRDLTRAVKRAKFLALLPVGSSKRF